MNATPENRSEKSPKWLALASPAEVFGPFTREELKSFVEAGRIAATAQFFECQDSLEEKENGTEVSAQATIDALQKECDEVRKAMKQLEKQNAELRAHEEHCKEGMKEMEVLRAKIAERDGWLSTLSTEISTARDELSKKEDEKRSLQERLEKLVRVEQERDELSSMMSQKDVEIKSLKEMVGRVHLVETEREELKGALALVEHDLEAIKAELKEEREKAATIEVRKKQVEDVLQGVKDWASELGNRLGPLEELQKPIEPQESVEEVECVDAVETVPEGDHRNRLASMEAQAMKELKMLRMRGAGGFSAWVRNRS